MYTIEKNVPIPEGGVDPKGLKNKYPFGQMVVGDSFLSVGDKYISTCAVRSAYAFAKPRGWKFKSRSEPGGIRIWRIA